MFLKKFAVLALVFTTASGFCMEPVTAVASDIACAGMVSYTDAVVDMGSTNTGTDSTNGIEDTPGVNTDAGSTETLSTGSSKQDGTGSTAKTVTKKKCKKKKSKSKKKYSKSELRLMSSIINCEAGIEPYQGKLAVGIVVMNRIKSKSFPDSLKGVIYQSGQFSPVRNGSLRRRLSEYDSGRIKSKQWKSCISAAKKVLNGQRTVLYRGKSKNMKSFHFFSVGLRGARLQIGGHKFK